MNDLFCIACDGVVAELSEHKDKLCGICFAKFRRWAMAGKKMNVCINLYRQIIIDFDRDDVRVAFDEWLEKGRPV